MPREAARTYDAQWRLRYPAPPRDGIQLHKRYPRDKHSARRSIHRTILHTCGSIAYARAEKYVRRYLTTNRCSFSKCRPFNLRRPLAEHIVSRITTVVQIDMHMQYDLCSTCLVSLPHRVTRLGGQPSYVDARAVLLARALQTTSPRWNHAVDDAGVYLIRYRRTRAGTTTTLIASDIL